MKCLDAWQRGYSECSYSDNACYFVDEISAVWHAGKKMPRQGNSMDMIRLMKVYT